MKQRKLNKSQKRLLKLIKKDYNWDWEFLMELEKVKLINMSEYFSQSQIVEGWEIIVRQINLCIKLIDIICDNFNDVKYVNVRNAYRFVKDVSIFKESDWKEQFIKNDLYVLKAENLYYEIRKRFTRTWWD